MDKSFEKLEYETQLYGFSSDEIVQEVTGIMSSAVDNAVETLNTFFSKNGMDSGIEEPGLMVKEEYGRALQDLMPKVKELVDNTFTIPATHLLPEDSLQKTQHTKDELEKAMSKTEELKQKIKELSDMESLLRNELQCLQIMEPKIAEMKQSQIAIRKALLETAPYSKRAINCAETTTSVNDSIIKDECDVKDLLEAKVVLEN